MEQNLSVLCYTYKYHGNWVRVLPNFLAAFCLLLRDLRVSIVFWHFFVHFLPLNMGRHNLLYQSRASLHSGSAAQIHCADVHDTTVSGCDARITSS